MSMEYVSKAKRIHDRLNNRTFNEWLRTVGAGNEVNSIINEMQSVDNDEDFNRLYRILHDKFIVAYYNDVVSKSDNDKRMAFLGNNSAYTKPLEDRLGNYESMKKSPVFSNSRFLNTVFDKRTGAKSNNVPLMRLIEDPYELDRAAYDLKVSPEELRRYVNNQFEDYKKRNAQKFWQQNQDARQEYLSKLSLDHYGTKEGGWKSKLSNVIGNAFMPEVTQAFQRGIKTGDFSADDIVVPAFKDLAANAASLFLPGFLGLKVGGVAAKYGWGKLATGTVDAATQGLTDGSIELLRQAASNYENFNVNNAKDVALTSATIPAGVTATTSALSQVRGLQRKIRRLVSGIKGNALNPKDIERENALAIYDEARDWVKKGGKTPYEEYVTDGNIQNVRDFIMASANAPKKAPSDDEIRNILMNRLSAIEYFEPPLRDELDAISYAIKNGTRRQKATAKEMMARMQRQWPENLKDMRYMDGPKMKIAKDLMNDAINLTARYEVAKQRGRSPSRGNAISPELEYIINNDPQMLKAWDNNLFTRGGDNRLLPEYVEYVELKNKGVL